MSPRVEIKPSPALAGAPITMTFGAGPSGGLPSEVTISDPRNASFPLPLNRTDGAAHGQFIVQEPGRYMIRSDGWEQSFEVGERRELGFLTEFGLVASSVLAVFITLIFTTRRRKA